MTHSEFSAFIRSLLGKVPTMAAREALADLNSAKGFEFLLRWEWVPKEVSRGPLLQKIDGGDMDIGFCSEEICRIFVHEDRRT